MSEKKIPNITKELLDEYYEKNTMYNSLRKDIMDISKKIKSEMEKASRLEVELYEYKIELETKCEPNSKFIELLLTNGMNEYINYSVSSSKNKSARLKLNISNAEYFEKYADEKDTKWLHVKKK